MCIHIQPKHATKQPLIQKVSVALSVWSQLPLTTDNSLDCKLRKNINCQ